MRRTGFRVWAVVFLPLGVLLCLAALHVSFARLVLPAVGGTYGVVGALGGFWLIYDALRYEDRPWKFILGALLIPIFFVWYYVDRARWRGESQRIPVALRHRRPS